MVFLESVKKATSSVLTKTPENELKTITLPILREKVAKFMKIEIEEFLGKDIKVCIMETFQEFLLKDNEKDVVDEIKKVESVSEEEPTKKKTKSGKPKSIETKTERPVKLQPEKPKPKSTEPQILKSKESQSVKPKPKETQDEKPKLNTKIASTKSAQIERLKSYVFKCGVRKVWKREFEGLNEKQCISKLKEILKDVGIEGKPTLEQCNTIRKRRELEAELREIDTSNIIKGKRRRDTNNKKLIISESEGSDSDEVSINLNALGDTESDSD